jgi:pteridine reductase
MAAKLYTPDPPSGIEPSTRLAGHTALVTGGARRVGAAIVHALHGAGANVVIHCHRSLSEAQALAAELESVRPDSTAVIACDLMDAAALPGLIGKASDCFTALHLLVNNASTFYPTPLGSITPAQWNDLIGSNLRAPLLLAQAAAPELRRTRGAVLNMVDIHGLRPLRDHMVYSVAKAGLIMLTRALARELAPEVRVNAIAPGPVLWPEAPMSEEQKHKIIDETPLHRRGLPEDIARAILFFASEAPFVTGQILAVDGGRSIGW